MLLEHDDTEFVEEQETGSDESVAFPLVPLKLSDLNAHGFPSLFAQQCYSSIVPWSQIQGCSVCLHREACDRVLTSDRGRVAFGLYFLSTGVFVHHIEEILTGGHLKSSTTSCS